jgi:hypothetical protein
VIRVSNFNLFLLLPVVTLLLSMGSATASGNFLPVRLPKGITVELPKNWTVLSNNQRITIDSWVQAKTELGGLVVTSSDLSFASNYYDDKGKTVAMFNIRYYPDITINQPEISSASAADIKELDKSLRDVVTATQKQTGLKILSWMGTTKQNINGIVAFVTEYRRAGIYGGSPFRVRLVRVLSSGRSFTITISYREDQGYLLRAICDRVISSIRM